MISRVGPTLAYAGHLQDIIGSLSANLCWCAYHLGSVSLAWAHSAIRFLALHLLAATKLGAFYGAAASVRAATTVQDMKRARMLRDKLFYKFVLFVLVAGNGLFLFILWPGWIVIGGTSRVLWQICG